MDGMTLLPFFGRASALFLAVVYVAWFVDGGISLL